ncbi:DUF952 domain-containing protein [Halorubrum sp. CGM5_25_10-8B]|uniref:DUF952 domain-containing protein n=1 Tax=Halorubrum sp. CGM5_25_10-8B TaxID=2518115 RepID=UPI0010F6DC96|nr:DUF952 domain-containing protein [Halorubrum sp. CGM5_25_10-8B]TKX35058.1 DUF952 domain-containing protein [Halorubrum sp. CGM5_25_10-8B]
MPQIVHALSQSDWQSFQKHGEYRPSSLETQGFVHCSKPGQIVVVADANHSDSDEMVLLLLDESGLDSPVRYETSSDGASVFPHVYGPLTLDGVIDSFPFPQDETGYRLPDELLQY